MQHKVKQNASGFLAFFSFLSIAQFFVPDGDWFGG